MGQAELISTEAQNLRCGDCIVFRNIKFTVLSSFTDVRHSQSILTCRSDRHLDGNIVYVMRLVRTYVMDRLEGVKPLTLVLMENTEDEVNSCRSPY